MTPVDFAQKAGAWRGLNLSAALQAPGDMAVAKNVDLYAAPERVVTRRGSVGIGSEEESGLGLPGDGVPFIAGGIEYLVWHHLFGALYSRKLSGATPPELLHAAALTIGGNAGGHLFAPSLNGLTRDNTDVWKLYYSIESAPGPLFHIVLYKDAARSQAVAEGIGDAGVVDITELNDSGISGTIGSNSVDVEDEDGTLEYAEYVLPSGAGYVLRSRNRRIYGFSEAGNVVVEWRSGEDRFAVRPMGLDPASIVSWDPFSEGSMTPGGQWTYGIEKVTRVAGGDILATGPRRRFADGSLPAVKLGPNDSAVGLRLGTPGDVEALEDDPYWTDLRVWRSRNQVSDLTDPLAPIDGIGTPDELYELALIPRVYLNLDGLNDLPTGPDLPPGNANVKVGIYEGVYTIRDANPDDALAGLVGLDYIDLERFPACSCGEWKSGYIFGAPPAAPYIVYSPLNLTPYQEQWDPQARLNTGNSRPITGLAQAWEHLVVFTESSTMYLPGSDVETTIQQVDDSIGVASPWSFSALREVGIVALCSDRMVRVLKSDLSWRQSMGKVDLATPILPLLRALDPSALRVSCAAVNGKVLMLAAEPSANSVMLALHYSQGKGWTQYEYPGAVPQILFGFGSGRTGLLSLGAPLRELEVDDLETDYADDATAPRVEGVASVGDFLAPAGNIVDVRRFTIFGEFTAGIDVTAISQGKEWTMTPAGPQPGLWQANATEQQREYWFQPKPEARGAFDTVPLRGTVFSFLVKTTGKACMYWGLAAGKSRPAPANLDAWLNGGFVAAGPAWASLEQARLNFEDPDDVFYDASRPNLQHAWSASGGAKQNRVAQAPGYGLKFWGGSVVAPEGVVVVQPGQGAWTWRLVLKLDAGAQLVASGSEGDYRWKLQAGGCGIRMDIEAPGDVAKHFYAPDVWLEPGVVYVVVFLLRKDLTGRFLGVAPLDAAWPGAPETVRGDGAALAGIPSGHSLRITGPASAWGTISYYAVEKADCAEEQARRFWGTVKAS